MITAIQGTCRSCLNHRDLSQPGLCARCADLNQIVPLLPLIEESEGLDGKELGWWRDDS